MKKTVRLGMLLSMDRYIQVLAAAVASLLLVACGSMRSSVVVEPAAAGVGYSHATRAVAAPARTRIPGGSYDVKKGETLYSIAFRNGVDFRDLAQWNAIATPYTIWPGQRLKLSPSSTITMAHAPGTPLSTSVPVPAPHAHAAPAPIVAGAPVFEPVSPSAATPASKTNATATATLAAPVKPAAPAVATTTTTVVPVAGVPTPPAAAVPPPAPPVPAAAGASRAVSGLAWRWPADGSLIKRFQSGDAIPGIEIAGKPGAPVRAAADGVVVYSGNGLVGYGELVIIKHNDSLLSAYGHNRKRLVKEGQRVSAGQQIAEMGSTGASRNELQFQIRKDGNPVDPLGYLPAR